MPTVFACGLAQCFHELCFISLRKIRGTKHSPPAKHITTANCWWENNVAPCLLKSVVIFMQERFIVAVEWLFSNALAACEQNEQRKTLEIRSLSGIFCIRLGREKGNTIHIKLCQDLWCSSVDWVPTCEPKGHWLDSPSGHMPGLQARSPVGGTWEATTHGGFSPSLSPSLPLRLKK